MKSNVDCSPDIDRGWAIVVLICTFLHEVLTTGFLLVNSIWFAVFLDEFQQSPVATSWAVNLSTFCSFSMSVFGNCFLALLGSRLTVVIGCIMSTVGLISCSFLPNLSGILGMYGIVTGSGFGFSRLAVYSMIPSYFIKYRIIATAVTVSGMGFGQFIYSPLVRFLIEEYQWRGAFIIIGALNMNLFVIAASLMTPRQSRGHRENVPPNRCHKVSQVVSALRAPISNLRMFRNPVWTLLFLRGIFIHLGVNGFQTHIFNFGRQSDIDLTSTEMTFLPSIVGISTIVGQLAAGGISQIPQVHVVLIYILMYLLLVIATIMITFANTYFGIVICCLLAGISCGGNGIIYEIIVHVVGLKKYSSGLSYIFLGGGTGLLLGGPFAAWIYELDPTYLWSFRICGLVSFIGIACCIPAWLTIKDGKICQRISKDEWLKQREEMALNSELPTDELLPKCETEKRA